MKKTQFITAIAIVVIAIFSRFLPLPANFSPFGAIALFSGAYFVNNYLKYILPIALLWVSDVIINNVIYSEYMDGFSLFYQGSLWIYLTFALIIFIGSIIKKKNQLTILIGSVGASVLFFLVSNFGVWFSTSMYAKNVEGLIQCYVMGIPFFKYTLASNFIFSAVFFGMFEVFTSKLNFATSKLKG